MIFIIFVTNFRQKIDDLLAHQRNSYYTVSFLKCKPIITICGHFTDPVFIILTNRFFGYILYP